MRLLNQYNNKFKGEVLDVAIDSNDTSIVDLFINYSDKREFLLKLYGKKDLYSNEIKKIIDLLFTDESLKNILKENIINLDYKKVEHIIKYEEIEPIPKESESESEVLVSNYHGYFGTEIQTLPSNIYLIQPKCCGFGSYDGIQDINKIKEEIENAINQNY